MFAERGELDRPLVAAGGGGMNAAATDFAAAMDRFGLAAPSFDLARGGLVQALWVFWVLGLSTTLAGCCVVCSCTARWYSGVHLLRSR